MGMLQYLTFSIFSWRNRGKNSQQIPCIFLFDLRLYYNYDLRANPRQFLFFIFLKLMSNWPFFLFISPIFCSFLYYFFLLLRRGLIKIISIIVKEKGKYTPYNIPCREADRLGAYIDEYHLPCKGASPTLFEDSGILFYPVLSQRLSIFMH